MLLRFQVVLSPAQEQGKHLLLALVAKKRFTEVSDIASFVWGRGNG